VILDQQVQARTTNLIANYARLSAKMIELCRLVIEIKSQMDDICAPFYWPHSPDEDLPHPPSSLVPLF
jgi:hypothetical protein